MLETTILVILILILLLVIVALFRAVQIVPQSYAIIVERLGKFQAEYGAGMHLLVPFVDRVRTTVDLREQVVSFPPQPVITSDNLVVSIDSVIYYQVTDPKRATYEIANYLQAIEQLTVTTLRNVIGAMDLEQTLTSRDQINGQLRGVLDQATGRWGIRVSNVELKSIDPPASIQGAMEQQMRAERDRRAAILTAEGVKQSQILTAEGDKQSAILRAEGQAQSAILKAQGESRAILQVFDAIHRGNADPKLLAYQYLQTLPKIANGSSSKMWIVPTEFTAALDGIAGALGGKSPGGPDSGAFGAGAGGDVKVDVSGMESSLDIAGDLAQTSLQAPEEALAQARGEAASASQEAEAADTPAAGRAGAGTPQQPGTPVPSAPETTALPTSGGRHADTGDSGARPSVPPSIPPSGRDA
ncbi:MULTISPECIES: SPFH domain-containing protein [unclassified Actinomyces]|uniref:SPFH domain-containing protein n=1 Tax=unclassified Actinomyces TaxID=2609248 RepID=UPI0013A69F29|nr:SPFH domain-containing protein [Actinomyces sp. 594]MBW3068189.1 SPFH/Band 7/PHB domain protein [Actinomyces sp. 594]NDR53202.1 SPFH/Band 7/PHB domain protein [Actinomyces sp. 565]